MHNLRLGYAALAKAGRGRVDPLFLGREVVGREPLTDPRGLRKVMYAADAWLGMGISLARRTRSLLQARRELRGADLVVMHGFDHPRILNLLGRLSRAPVAYMPHSPVPMHLEIGAGSAGLSQRRRARWAYRAERTLFERASFVVFPSAGATHSYAGIVGEGRDIDLRFVASGVNVPAVDERRVKKDVFSFAFAGRYSSHKGYDLYCAAAALLLERGAEAHFLSLGTGDISPSGPVQDLGWVTEPHSVLASCHVVVIPNRDAFYDLLPLEVAHLGCSLVFTPAGGNVDQANALPDSVMARAIEPGALADAMAEAQGNYAMKDGSRNRETALSLFTAQSMASRWDDMLADWRGSQL